MAADPERKLVQAERDAPLLERLGAARPAGRRRGQPCRHAALGRRCELSAGGVAITDAAGTTAYACSGSDGAPGADGEPFSGTFTSPNGQYSISVADTGITLKRTTPGGASIALHDDDITVKSSQTVNVEAGTDLKLKGSVSALVEGGGFATVKAGALTAVSGGLVTINGPGCRPAARLNDTVTSGLITTGSATVCIGG